MNKLRRTIRRLILEMEVSWDESTNPYAEYSEWEENNIKHAKLMKLIASGDTESIVQGLELSVALDKIGSYSYEEELISGYSGKKLFHYYELVGPFDEDFIQKMRSTHKYGSDSQIIDMTEPDDEVIVLMFVEDVK